MNKSKISRNKKLQSYLLSLLVIAVIICVGIYLETLSQTKTTNPSSTLLTTSQATTTIGKTNTTITTTIWNINPKASRHVIVIVLENKNMSSVVGNPDAPYINNVLIPNYSISERFFAVEHPSRPNYLAMIFGSVSNLTTSIIGLFPSHNITWEAYMESMQFNSQSPCLSGFYNSSGEFGYVYRHNPFLYVKDIANNLTECNDVVPLTPFYTELASNSLPQFSFVVPNELNDGEMTPTNPSQCPPSGTSLRCADKWLSVFLPKIINNKVFSNTTIFITWDEAESLNAPNQVLLIAVSPHAKKGFAENTTFYNDYSIPATIERMYNLGTLGKNDTTANVMNGLFLNNTLP